LHGFNDIGKTVSDINLSQIVVKVLLFESHKLNLGNTPPHYLTGHLQCSNQTSWEYVLCNDFNSWREL